MRKLKLGILSTSRIVEEFLKNAREMPELEPISICCRPQSRAKAEKWARQGVGPAAVFTSEAEFFAQKDYDAVYIGTANQLHYAAAKSALAAGHSVILEKPFTATAAEARELYALADAKGVFLLEAITVPYLPRYRFLRRQLEGIGPVRGALLNFSKRSARYDDYLNHIWNTTFDPACFGGALNDMNLYNLHLLWGLLGMPKSCEYRPNRGYNGIDTAGTALLDYGGFTAACLAGKDSGSENGFLLQGPGGCIVLHGDPNSLEGELYAETGGRRIDAPAQGRHRMAYEFAEFARILLENDRSAEAAARRRTVEVMELLEALHKNAG